MPIICRTFVRNDHSSQSVSNEDRSHCVHFDIDTSLSGSDVASIALIAGLIRETSARLFHRSWCHVTFQADVARACAHVATTTIELGHKE